MAFDATNLARLGHANGVAFWVYKTTDTAAVIDTVDYFLGAIDYLNLGDMIYCHVDTDGTPAYGFFAVNQNDGTNIDVANLVSLSGSDTD